ncbi:MAG TPA: metallophosphoesterase [Candidatus Dormibacteraeota bacterium]|nr:metallophosphoesterase [Candidatus Dormibacteraeota bacterium]
MNRFAHGLFGYSLFLIAFISSAGSGLAATTNNAALWRPRFATPAIVALDSASNRIFTAEIKASASAKNWTAAIANDLKSWPCEVVSSKHATINRGTEPGWQVRVRVPGNVSPELFTLTLSNNETVSVQPQSVSVTPEFAKDFYLLHISDEQIVNEHHNNPSGQFYNSVGTWEEMKWMQEPVNLINPRFVIVTGDQIDFNGALDGWNNWANWGYEPHGKKHFTKEETLAIEERLTRMYLDCHKGYRVPYVETPGNHDVPPPGKLLAGTSVEWFPIGVSFYENYFGQRSWSFCMGDFYVLMHDWSDSGLKAWAAKDFEGATSNPAIKYRLLGQHFHTKWNGAATGNSAYQPDSCDLMLIGHGHVCTTVQTSPYYIYEDGPAFKYGTTGFFNFRRTASGWSCDQTVSLRSPTNDFWPLFTANGETKKVRCDQPDSMNVTANTVTITNDLPQNFYDGRLRFVLAKGNYRTVKNGTILAQYDAGSKTAVLVRVNIPASGTITVTLPPATIAER